MKAGDTVKLIAILPNLRDDEEPEHSRAVTVRLLGTRRSRAIRPGTWRTGKRNPLRRSPFPKFVGAEWNCRGLSSMRERFWLYTRNSRQAWDSSHGHPRGSAKIPVRRQKVAYRGHGGIVRYHWQRRRCSERECDFWPEGTNSRRCASLCRSGAFGPTLRTTSRSKQAFGFA
jgi:hypothetical protein